MSDAPPIPPELALEGPEPFGDDDLDRAAGGETVERVDRWHIDGIATAEWARRKVAQIDAQLRDVAENEQAFVKRIKAWAAGERRRLESRRNFFAGHLIAFLRDLREADPKRKTLELPSGKVSSRETRTPRVKITDEKALVTWAVDNAPELVVPAWDLNKDKVRSVVEAKALEGEGWMAVYGGERVPGVEIDPPHIDYSVPAS